MSFVNGVKLTGIGILAILISACDGLTDDLQPTGKDQRQAVIANTIGSEVTQLGPDFTLSDTLGVPVTLSSEWQVSDGVILYFTMWCPTCDEHMGHLRSHIVDDFQNVSVLFVDYVSGDVPSSRASQRDNGYSDFRVLVDMNDELEDGYHATMGTTIVIDSLGVVRMNEDYKDGRKLRTVLEAL